MLRSAEALPALGSWLLPPEHLLNQNSSYLVVFLVAAAILLWRQTEMPRAAHVTFSAALLTTPMFPCLVWDVDHSAAGQRGAGRRLR
ncbi:MAG: hypothetical protein IPJ98_12825 [Bryobacterales bacterium]|nr:hypothetical protein [Bryobacterales bacterium]